MAYIEILTANGLTVTQWEDDIFSEYLQQLWWSNVMGTSSNAIIQMRDDLSKKAGDAIVIGLRSQLLGGHVVGNAKGIGNEGRVDFFNQRITIDNSRELVKFEDVPMSEQRTMFNLLQQGREALVDQTKQQLEDDITAALTDTSVGRVRGRYLYGNLDSNWNATHTTALTNVDNTNDQLSTLVISIAKRKATIPVNATAKVRPMRVQVGQAFEEWYTMVAHPYCIRDLVDKDTRYLNQQLNLPPNSNRESPLFTGSSFKGSHNGVLIYEYDRMPLLSSTIQVGHCLLMGAQAGAVVWGQRAKFGEEMRDVGHDVIYELHEIRGIKKLVFSRATPEDQGVVNVFAAAVAD